MIQYDEEGVMTDEEDDNVVTVDADDESGELRSGLR